MAQKRRFTFDGTGVIVVGPYLPKGGKADVYLDGKLDRTVDVYPDENSIQGGESVWHAFGLKNGKHAVRVVVKGEPGPGQVARTSPLRSLLFPLRAECETTSS